jgi:hypothetical protein
MTTKSISKAYASAILAGETSCPPSNARLKKKTTKWRNNRNLRTEYSSPASARSIRTGLLHKLGFKYDDRISSTSTSQSLSLTNQFPTSVVSRDSLLGDVTTFREALKYRNEKSTLSKWVVEPLAILFGTNNSTEEGTSVDLQEEPSLTESDHSVDSSTSSVSTKRRLTFDEEVEVMPIPMRDEYSDRIRDRLWTSPTEIRQNAHRNVIEFEAEGWDWQSVVEDEGMYRCAITNERIHPTHLQGQHEYYST